MKGLRALHVIPATQQSDTKSDLYYRHRPHNHCQRRTMQNLIARAGAVALVNALVKSHPQKWMSRIWQKPRSRLPRTCSYWCSLFMLLILAEQKLISLLLGSEDVRQIKMERRLDFLKQIVVVVVRFLKHLVPLCASSPRAFEGN